MKNMSTSLLVLAAVSFLFQLPAAAQKKPAEPARAEPGRAVVSLYHVAPGKHLDFLKWLAAREAVDKEVGAPPAQLYAHTDGDSWDFMVVAPQLEPAAQAELEKKIEAASKKHGLTTGLKQGLEIRQFLLTHTDTFVRGPVSASAVVEEASKP